MSYNTSLFIFAMGWLFWPFLLFGVLTLVSAFVDRMFH